MLIGAAAAVALYLAGRRRLRRRWRGDLAGAGRAALFIGGVAVVVLALVSPLDPIGEEYLLSGHMLPHLLLGDVGPVLIVLGLAGPLALFAVPRPVLRAVARRRPLRRAVRVVTLPAVAIAVWIAVTAGWHVPLLFEYALAHRWAHDLEHASMFLAGMLVFLSDIHAATPGDREAPRIVRAWAFYNEAAMWCLIAFCASGVYLWLSSAARDVRAWALLATGTIAMAALWASFR